MAKSDIIIKNFQEKLKDLSSTDISDESGKVEFLRELLTILNKFFFEKKTGNDIEELESTYYKNKLEIGKMYGKKWDGSL
ncbi:MAG: hypothetical protein A2Z72_02210 [Omnitrophica bacterium RBG_13_46_9]|nr:MAG: hypothetical protein A2Z72_02210 [Omnitrophica bacterium RBG_13_46_9]